MSFLGKYALPLIYFFFPLLPETVSPSGVTAYVLGSPFTPQYCMVVFNRMESLRAFRKPTTVSVGTIQPAPVITLSLVFSGPWKRKKLAHVSPGFEPEVTISPVAFPKSEYWNSRIASSESFPFFFHKL